MKRLFAYILLLSIAFFVISCADVTTAKGTVEYMIEHMKRGNVEEAAKVLDQPELMKDVIEAVKDPVQAVVTKKIFEKGTFQVGGEVLEGDMATVEVKIESLSGEGTTILRELLAKAKDDLSSELSEEQVKEELEKAADAVEWNGLTKSKQKVRYHLQKEGDRWKILAQKTEVLVDSEEDKE